MVNSVSHHLLKQASFLHFTWHNINLVPRVHSLPLSKTLGTRLTSRHTCSPLPLNHAISHTNELLVFTVSPSKIKIVLWEDMSLAAMNSLYKNQALAEQNHSSRQSRCVRFLIGTCTFCHCLLRAISALQQEMLVQRPQVKLKLTQIRFWDYCNFLPRLSTQMS